MTIMRMGFARLAGALALALGIAGGVALCPPDANAQAQKPNYTMPEYKAYQAAAAEQNPQQKIKLLDAFVAQYPSSELLLYIYDEYLKAYSQLKDWPKVIECFDKKLALPALDKNSRLQALFGRAQTYELAVKSTDPNLKDEATNGRNAALEGLKVLDTIEKPAGATDEQFAAGKKQIATQFYNIAALSSAHLKDYKAAAENYAKSAELNEQAVIEYRLGVAELMETPPQANDGFWALARAVALKIPDADKITKFLRDKVSDYQSPVCDSSVDAEVKEMLTLAQTSATRPATFSIPSAADIAKARDRETGALIVDLRAGGDKGKLTWLAVCNGVFPEAFLAKTYEVNAANPAAIELKVAIGTSEEELNATTAPDTVLKITAQPDAVRLSKDDIFRFAGKLTGYIPSPFQLSFEDVKINSEDIPAEKGKAAPKKPGRKPAGRL